MAKLPRLKMAKVETSAVRSALGMRQVQVELLPLNRRHQMMTTDKMTDANQMHQVASQKFIG